MNRPIHLGVNVDHVATVRQARGTAYPDPVHAALEAERAGADGITMHLRGDRRHIQDRDVERYAEAARTKLNFECGATDEMRAIALRLRPADVCLVPETREELTTEGGLDVAGQLAMLTDFTAALAEAGIRTSMFIDPEEAQIEASVRAGAPAVELHTGRYADAPDAEARARELERLARASSLAERAGLLVNAGHGLHYHNVRPVAALPEVHELNIGHAIVARALFDGLGPAVERMRRIMVEARRDGDGRAAAS